MWIQFTIFFVEDGLLFTRRILEDVASTLLDFENVKSQEQACKESREEQWKQRSSWRP